MRTFVQVDDDGVVVTQRGLRDDLGDIAQDDVYATVSERIARQLAQGAFAPVDHAFIEIHQIDAGIAGQAVEGRTQRKAHAQSAQQDARLQVASQGLTCALRQGIFRAVCSAGHQHAAIDHDQKVAVAALAQLQGASRSTYFFEGQPRAHSRLCNTGSLALPSASFAGLAAASSAKQ